MSISMRDLFSRQGIAGEVISLRNSLANHPGGLKMSLREAHRRLLTLADGDGFSRGCRRPGSLQIDFIAGKKEVGLMLPACVPIAGKTSVIRDLYDWRDTFFCRFCRRNPDDRGHTY